jgi:hypothetical protein
MLIFQREPYQYWLLGKAEAKQPGIGSLSPTTLDTFSYFQIRCHRMASHQLAIAKASFTAGLLRPDPISVSRDEISHFHALVNLVANQCSPTNIQV